MKVGELENWRGMEVDAEVDVDGDVLALKEKRGCALAWRCG